MNPDIRTPPANRASDRKTASESIAKRLTHALSPTAAPLNLAVFRIAVFASMLRCEDYSISVWYSSVPREFIVPPSGLGYWLQYIPINPTIDSFACVFFGICCLTAMSGFHTRKSALVSAILGLYVLGLPQMFGKVNHDTHILIWSALILAACNCADVLSVDAAIKGWKKAKPNLPPDLRPSVLYGVPLRLVWLLLGIVYFFPGYWKLRSCGLAWALHDNLRYWMYSIWVLQPGGWLPLFRIDHFPWLYQATALATMVFEISFLFLVFFPFGRVLAVFGGVLFHSGTALFMNIKFFELQACYTALCDWQRLCNWLGRRLFPERMTVTYDNSDPVSLRIFSMLNAFDVLGRVDYRPGASVPNAGTTAVCAEAGSSRSIGIDAYLDVIKRIPVCWPLLPLWPLLTPVLRQQLSAIDKQKLQEGSQDLLPDSRSSVSKHYAYSLLPVIAVGSIIVFNCVLCGITKARQSWPFACYPTFDSFPSQTAFNLTVVPFDEQARQIALRSPTLQFRGERWQRFWPPLLKGSDEDRQTKLTSLWRFFQRNDRSLQNAHTVRFYLDTIAVDPELWSKNPIQRTLVYELTADR